MRTIWKFTLDMSESQRIEMPCGAQILDIQMQDGLPRIWALVETGDHVLTEMRVFEIHGTGQQIDPSAGLDGLYYRATFQQPPFVWHVFERTAPKSRAVVGRLD